MRQSQIEALHFFPFEEHKWQNDCRVKKERAIILVPLIEMDKMINKQ